MTQESWVKGMDQFMEYFLGLINQHVIMLDPIFTETLLIMINHHSTNTF